MDNVAAVQDAAGSGNTALFYQDLTGNIMRYMVTGPFNTGHTHPPGVGTLVPAAEALPNTPIAASIIGSGSTGVS